jgi:hypothetical protein
MSSGEVHQNDIGTDIVITVKDENGVVVDISTASVLSIIMQKPNNTKVTKTAAKVGTGTDGKMHYVTLINDLDQAGIWTLQAYVEITAGKWYSDYQSMIVYPNL